MVLSVTMTMENFIYGICISNPSDISFRGISYAQCLNECRARTDCMAINVHANLKLCRLNMDNTGVAEADCTGFVWSQKGEWSQVGKFKKSTLSHRIADNYTTRFRLV